jgi:septal ring factor EnvC (AmiA/AmiB activator)
MEDFFLFIVDRLKAWAYSPTVLRDVAVLILFVVQMWLVALSSQTIRRFRQSTNEANQTTQAAMDVIVTWNKRIMQLEARVAALEQMKPQLEARVAALEQMKPQLEARVAALEQRKPHLRLLAKELFARKGNGDASEMSDPWRTSDQP